MTCARHRPNANQLIHSRCVRLYENLYRITLLSSEGEQWLIQKLIVDVDDGASS